MKTVTRVAVGFGVVMVAAGGYLAHGLSSAAPAKGKRAYVASEAETTAALRAQVEQLRAQMTNLSNNQAMLGANLRAIGSTAGGTQTAQPVPPEEPESSEGSNQQQLPTREELEAQARHRIQTMEARFSAEPVDSEWGPGAVNDIRDKINVSQAAISDVKCGTTLCRFSLSSASGDRTMSDIDEALKQRPWSGQAFFYVDQKEPTKANIYLARAGAELPRFD